MGTATAGIAHALMLKNIAQEIVIIDENNAKSIGESIELKYGIPFMGTARVYVGEYRDMSNSNLIVVIAGRNRWVGESSLDVLITLYNKCMNIPKERVFETGYILDSSRLVDVIADYIETNIGNVNAC